MRKIAVSFLFCLFFFLAFYAVPAMAQTATFSKLSPKWNETLWKKDYTYTWTFSWKPYTGGASFNRYIIRFYNNSGSMVKELVVPGGASATSMNIDFTNMSEIQKGNQYYTWSLGAFNNSTLVAESDHLPSSTGTRSGFRVPSYVDLKSYTLNATIQCPANTVLDRNIRPFWAAWTEHQNHPYDFSWSYQSYSKSTKHTVTIKNRTANDSLYFGLESDLSVQKKLYNGSMTTEPLELIPAYDIPWGSNMDAAKIYRGTWFNPYTNMTAWHREKLPTGSYNLTFLIPTPYDKQWCITPECTKNDDCASGACSNNKCGTSICTPTLTAPTNGSVISVAPPTFTWTQCPGAHYSQMSITGGNIAWTSLVQKDTRSYTPGGLTFNSGNTFTWKVRACADSTCTKAGSWVTGTFTYTAAPVCTKTGGVDAFKTGSLTTNASGYTSPVADYCTTKTGTVYSSSVASCDGANCYVAEHSCTGTTPKKEYIRCVNGCANGACVTTCNGQTCSSGQYCHKNVCRQECPASGTCAGDYHCDYGVCVPGRSSSSSSTVAPNATATPFPTAAPDKAGLMFKVKMPDVASTVGTVPNVKLQVRDGGTIVTEASLILQRVSGTDFFRTASPLSLEIPSPKQYTVFLKQQKSIRRSFTVTLAKGQTADCAKDAPDATCGSLGTSHLAPLFSGDSDGFNDGSPGTTRSDSYNKVDAGDASRMIEGYKKNPLPDEPNADFNLDRKIDIFDLAILGKNYGKKGE